MGIFGKGWLGDVGKTLLNNAATPLETVTGQNFYQPELEAQKHRGYGNSLVGNINTGIDAIGGVAGQLAPSALNALAPGAGTALSMGRGMLPLMGDATTKGPQDGTQGIAGLASMAGMFAGGNGQGQVPQVGNVIGTQGVMDSNAMQGAFQYQGDNNPFAQSQFGQMGGVGGQYGSQGVPAFEGFNYGGAKLPQNQQLPGFRMPFGGQLPYGEGPGEQTGPNLATFNGPSHEEGGIPFNGIAELEKQETVDMDEKFVYSDRLKVPGKKITFANASKKYKDNGTDDDITKNTNKLMLEKLKNQQEGLKKEQFDKDQAAFLKKHGGYLEQHAQGGEYAHGGYLPSPEMRGGVSYGGRSNYGGSGVNYGGGNTTYMADGGPLLNNSAMQALYGLDSNNVNMGALQNYVGAPATGFNPIGSNYVNAPGPDYGAAARYTNAPGADFSGTDNYINAPSQGTAGIQGGPGSNPLGGFDMNQALQSLPAGYAFAQGAQGIENFNPNINPEYDAAIGLAAGRRYDAQPEIDQALRTRNVAFKGVRDASGGNAAVELGNLKGAQILSDRAIRQSLANKTNRDNLYKLQEAQFRAQLGQGKSTALNKAQLYDMQARAARDAFTQKGFDAVGKQGNLSQTNQIYQQLIDAGYGDLGPMQKFARKYSKSK